MFAYVAQINVKDKGNKYLDSVKSEIIARGYSDLEEHCAATEMHHKKQIKTKIAKSKLTESTVKKKLTKKNNPRSQMKTKEQQQKQQLAGEN